MKHFLLLVAVLLSGCAREEWRAPLAPDTGKFLLPTLPAGSKYKFTGPVTFTIATAPGAVATSTSTDNRKAGQRGGAAATAPGSAATATATTKKGGLPWWVFAVVGLLSIAGWEWLTHQFSLTAWLPWRIKPG